MPLIDSFLISLPNVERLLQAPGSCTVCDCNLYIEGRHGQCASVDCGHPPDDHSLKFNQINPLDIRYPAVANEITILIHGHGCDIPFLLENAHQALWNKVSILSSVPHGCLNVGMTAEFLNIVNTIYKNRTTTQQHNLIEASRLLTDLSKSGQAFYKNDPAIQSFLYIPHASLYRIHTPVIDRRYTFERRADEHEHVHSFGIYVLYSSGEYTEQKEDVFYNYLSFSELSQKNNLLSPDVHPSLLKYTTLLREPGQGGQAGQVKKQIELHTILHSLFFDPDTRQARPWQKVRVIDLGCRIQCDGLGALPGAIDAATITARETAAAIPHHHAGKKQTRRQRGVKNKGRQGVALKRSGKLKKGFGKFKKGFGKLKNVFKTK